MNIEQLARDAADKYKGDPVWNGTITLTLEEMERLRSAIIAAERKRLLEGSGEAVACIHKGFMYMSHEFMSGIPKDADKLYTADQLAAAVLRATLAERASHKPNCKECEQWAKEQADNKEWVEGVAEGKRIVEELAAAIRGQK